MLAINLFICYKEGRMIIILFLERQDKDLFVLFCLLKKQTNQENKQPTDLLVVMAHKQN